MASNLLLYNGDGSINSRQQSYIRNVKKERKKKTMNNGKILLFQLQLESSNMGWDHEFWCNF